MKIQDLKYDSYKYVITLKLKVDLDFNEIIHKLNFLIVLNNLKWFYATNINSITLC